MSLESSLMRVKNTIKPEIAEDSAAFRSDTTQQMLSKLFEL